MSEPFIGEIRMFGFNFAPRNWATCDGQLLPISQNTALFSILGTTYGGDGKSNFRLPNMQGSTPLQSGQGSGLTYRPLGESGGSPTVTLQPGELPSHTHTLQCASVSADQTSPANDVPAAGAGQRGAAFYADAPGNASPMKPGIVSTSGGNAPHNNMPPYLALNFCIALQGIYPPRP